MLRIWRAVGVQPAIYLPPTLIFTATTLRWCRRLSGKMHFYALRGPALFLPVLLFLCPFQQRIHERTRPLRPCLAIASSIYLQSTVNRCPTNRPTGCSLLRSRWRRMIDHLPANAFPFEIRGDTRCCLVCFSGSPLSNASKKSKDVSSRHQCTVERIDDYAVVVAC